MRLTDAQLAEAWDRGFVVIEGFLDKATLAEAQEALWDLYPRPEAYFADPGAYPKFSKSQFSGLRFFPYGSWALNRLPVLSDLVDAAERFCGTEAIEIYKVELWAKYSGAVNYDQPHHRDFGNHTLVVPCTDGFLPQMTTFILLSDVTEQDGPTKLVPLEHTRDIPLIPGQLPMGELFDKDVAATAPAGSLMIYRTDVMHRGSDFTAPGRSRFAMLVDFQARGYPWRGKMAWPNHAEWKGMTEAMVRMSVRQRDLFGWPPPGSPYWRPQTLRDVAARYPGIDLAPYAAGVSA